MKWKIEKKVLEKLYLEERKSIDKIEEVLSVPRYAVNYWRKKYGIKRLNYFERHPLPRLSKIQKEYLVGALLGDDRLGKKEEETYPSLKAAHSEKQRDYVVWKYNIWKNLVPGGIKKIDIKLNGKVYPTRRFQTREHPTFLEFYKLFYDKGKKKVNRKILDQLTPFSLAIWYMDDGTYIKSRGRSWLATNSFTYREHLLIQKYFKERWNLPTTIGISDSGTHYLKFNTENTIKFLKLVENYVIPCFSYKIEPGRKLLYRKISSEEIEYIKNNCNIKSTKFIAQKLRRPFKTILEISRKWKLT